MLTKKQNRIGLLFFSSLIGLALMAGCSSKSTLDTPTPDGSSGVVLAASPTSVETSETSVIEATVTASGVAVANQVVEFTVSPAGSGTVTPAVDTTDASGVAAAVFTALASGSVVVTGATPVDGRTGTVTILVSEGAVVGSGNLTIAATETLLMADGHDTSSVTVVVRDQLGQFAPNGTVVKLVAGERFVDVDGNGYWSQGIDTLQFDANGNEQWDSYGTIPATAIIAGGTVVVDFISGQEAYTVYLKATVDEGGIVGSAEMTVQISPNATLNSIYLASDSVSLSVRGTGGIETSTLRAIGYDPYGNPVPEGQPIYFRILDGPGGGLHLAELDSTGVDTAYTNGQGMATSVISSGTVSGTVRIRAQQGTVISTATQILIAAGPPDHIVVGTEFCNAPLWNTVGDSIAVVAVVGDYYDNPVNDSTVVYFTCDEGTIMSHHGRTWGGKGIETTVWISGVIQPPADGIVWIWAETSGGTVLDSTYFINSWGPDSLFVTGWEGSIDADGLDKFIPTVHARDVNGNYVVGGTPFKARAKYLTVTGGIFEDGCVSASGEVDVTSAVLPRDYSITYGDDDGIGAVDYVTYSSGSASITMTCNLLTDDAHSSSSSITGPTTAQPGEELLFTVNVGDADGNPLADHTMFMSANDGLVTSSTHETNGRGEASGFIWIAPALDGDYNVNVTDQDPRGAGMVLTVKVSVKAAT